MEIELFRALVDHLPLGVAVYHVATDDPGDSRLVYANAQASRESEVDLQALIGGTIRDLTPMALTDPPEANFPAAISRVAISGVPETMPQIHFGDTREPVGWYRVDFVPIAPGFAAAVYRNITTTLKIEADLRDHEAGLARANVDLRLHSQALKRSNEDLERFAYVASHDLQEPLRMVGSYLQLIKRRYYGKIDQDANEFIDFAVDGANRMKQLINDLLHYSRVTTRGQPFAAVEMEALWHAAKQNLSLMIEDTHAAVTHDPLPAITGDWMQLGQLLQNLLNNALKFRTDTPPRVHLSAARGTNEWCFSLRDNGIGIEERYFTRIFEIFQRLHSGDKFPGTGMGLALCQKIVLRHGGKIWVESTPSTGSTFFFTIPDTPIDVFPQ